MGAETVHHNNPVFTVGGKECLKSSHLETLNPRMLVQLALTDYHQVEIKSRLLRRPLPTRKQNES